MRASRKRPKNFGFVVTKKGIKPSDQAEKTLFEYSRKIMSGESVERQRGRPRLSPEERSMHSSPRVLERHRVWYRDNIDRERARQAFRDKTIKPEFKPVLRDTWVKLGIKPFRQKSTK